MRLFFLSLVLVCGGIALSCADQPDVTVTEHKPLYRAEWCTQIAYTYHGSQHGQLAKKPEDITTLNIEGRHFRIITNRLLYNGANAGAWTARSDEGELLIVGYAGSPIPCGD